MTAKQTLLPCPFCGREPRAIENDGYGDCMIFCPGEFEGCEVSPSVHMTKERWAEAVAVWNMRYQP